MKKIFVLTLFCFSAIAFAQKPIFTSAKIKSATVYSNSAELLQSAAVTLPSGTSEIVIKNVADYVNENTIQIGAPANVTVLSVQFTRNFISEYEIDESNPMIKRVRDSIMLIEKEMGKIANEKVSYSKTIDLLDKNQNVAGQNSGLNVTELIKLVDYYRAKRNELSNLVDALYEKENKLKDCDTDFLVQKILGENAIYSSYTTLANLLINHIKDYLTFYLHHQIDQFLQPKQIIEEVQQILLSQLLT